MEIRELSISGGGVRGYGFFGSLYYLWKHNFLKMDKLRSVACVSIGSWLGAGLCLGYNPLEMGDYFFELDISKIKDIELSRFFQRKSLLKGDNLNKFINDLIKNKTDVDITLKQLYNISGIHLTIVTVCLNNNRVVYLNHIDYPDLELRKALLMSSSIPGVFPPVEYKNRLYIDGGLIDNNPIHILSEDAWGICQDVDQIDDEIKINNMFDYTIYIMRTIYNNVNVINKTKKGQTLIKVKIDNTIGVTSFGLSKDEKYCLIQQGYMSTQNQVNYFFLKKSIKKLQIQE